MSIEHTVRFMLSLLLLAILVMMGVGTYALYTVIGWWALSLPVAVAFLWVASSDAKVTT